MDLRGVVEDDPSKVLGGVPPPLALLGPIAVASRLLLRGEADHGDAPAVFGDPRGGTEPAVGVGGELPLPAAQIPADPRWVGRSTLDDLNEHGPLSFSASVPSPGAVSRTTPTRRSEGWWSPSASLHPSDPQVPGDIRHHLAGHDGAQPDDPD